MKSAIISLMGLLACAAIGKATWAQEAPRVTAEPNANAFYMEYDILEDVEGCDGDNEIAYQVSAKLTELAFVVQNDTGFDRLDFGFPEPRRGRACYRIERRGVERVQIEQECSPNQLDFRQSERERIAATLDLDIKISSCLSPTKINLIEGDWTATLSEAGNEAIITGDLSESPTGSEAPLGATIGSVSYSQVKRPYFRWLNDGRDNPVSNRLAENPSIFVDLQCLPMQTAGDNGQRLFARASMFLFLSERGDYETCVGEGCLVLDDARYLSGSRQNCVE